MNGEVFGVAFNGRLFSYYLVFAVCAALFLALLRIVNSPFGRVLEAIRENPLRAEALGYRIVFHRTLATCLAAAGATVAGALNALWLRYVGPDTALAGSIQIAILVVVVIGGMGTLYGAVLGAALFVIAQNYLQALLGALSKAAATLACRCSEAVPPRPLAAVARLLFVLAVYFAPAGLVGASGGKESEAGRQNRRPASPCGVTGRAPHRLDPGLGPKAKGRQS